MNTLTLSYSGNTAPATGDLRVILEQPPVASNRLTLSDLEQMLAMASGGIPAQTYDQPVCPATVVAGEVEVPLTFWAWPSELNLAYALAAPLGELTGPIRIEQEREFDVVLNFEARVTLPFYARDLSWEWTAMPCFNRLGAEIEPPELTITPGAILSTGDFLGVIRVRCRAIGDQYVLTLRLPKTTTEAITDVTASVLASWVDGSGATATAALDLELPRCVEQLLAACPDGELQREKYYGGAAGPDVNGRPVVYYNACNGEVLAVRRER